MALILKTGAIFLHIPKTGGNWITAVLNELDLVEGRLGHKHADPSHLLAPVNPKAWGPFGYLSWRKIRMALEPKPFMFCFVRHPLKWYESWYKYMIQPSRNWKHWGDEQDLFDWHPNAVLNGCGSDSFDEFVRNVVTKRPGYVTELYSSYVQPQVGFVGRQETLREDLVQVLRRMNVNFDEDFVMNFKEVGVSPVPGRKVEWETELREHVLALEQVAMIRYGYAAAESKAVQAGQQIR